LRSPSPVTSPRVATLTGRRARPSPSAFEATARDARPASQIRTPARRCVAVVIAEPTADLFESWFFRELLSGIHDGLEEQSLLMSLITSNSAREKEMAQAYLAGGHVDGVIMASLHGDDPLPRMLAAGRVPVVVCSRPPKDSAVGFVDTDNRQAGRLAVEHLISVGCKKIAMISGNLDTPSSLDRVAGYRDALNAAGIALDPTLEEVAYYKTERVIMAMERLLINHRDLDGVFAASDTMAKAAMRALQRSRKRVPEDVAVIGFDDTPLSVECTPPLSSMRQPIEKLGREAVAMLLRAIAEPGDPPAQVIFKAELVSRESTRRG
jgi:DNA-binding LacI/PurR family transcriptional regulator